MREIGETRVFGVTEDQPCVRLRVGISLEQARVAAYFPIAAAAALAPTGEGVAALLDDEACRWSAFR
jgi:hypothetical protein